MVDDFPVETTYEGDPYVLYLPFLPVKLRASGDVKIEVSVRGKGSTRQKPFVRILHFEPQPAD